MNPYATPTCDPAYPATAVCVRRWDVTVIALVCAVLGIASFGALAFPTVNEWMMPRFGWGGNSVLFPLNFLLLYLWRPGPRLIAMASFMFFFTSVVNTVVIGATGTVAVVENPFNDRLPSSYAWSVLPSVLLGLYLAAVAWQTRDCVARETATSSAD